MNIVFETMRGSGPGGQHRNKTDSCVRATHVPTGVQVTIDGRSQSANKRKAVREIKRRLRELDKRESAEKRKKRRDEAIHDRTIVRTYDFSRGIVKDHRTKKTGSIKNVLEKGRFDSLTEELRT